MKWILRHVFAGIAGFFLPWLVALTNLIPFLGHATPYETVLWFMVAGAVSGLVISIALRGPKA